MTVYLRKALDVNVVNQEDYGDVWNLPVADAKADGTFCYIPVGDPVMWSLTGSGTHYTSYKGVLPLTTADDTNEWQQFAGIALQLNETVDAQQFINVAVRCRARVKLDSAAEVLPGQGLKWASGVSALETIAGVDRAAAGISGHRFTAVSGGILAICWACEYNPSTSDELLVMFDAYLGGEASGDRFIDTPADA